MDNISQVNGKAEIAYVGEVPWHKLGTKVSQHMTSEEAIRAANLDWNVEVNPVFYKASGDTFLPIPKRFATVRKDTQTALGVVGRCYTPIQNADAFSFFDHIVADGKARYEVAGALGKGETIWILANIGGELRIEGTDDISKKYLLLTNTHDGTMALRMFYTPIRVVCQNTLNASIGEAGRTGIYIKHFPNIEARVKEAQKILGIATAQYVVLEQAFNALSKYQVNVEELERYIHDVFPMSDPNKEEPGARIMRKWEDVETLFHAPENSLPGVRGSAWAAYNSVTMYVDHVQQYSRLDKDPTRKLRSIWIEGGAQVKRNALDKALEMAGLPKIEAVVI